MSDKGKMIQRLEMIGTVTFWVSCIGGGIILLMGFQGCSAVSNAMGDLGRYADISGIVSSIFGFFIIIDLLLMVCGIGISCLAKTAAVFLKEDHKPINETKAPTPPREAMYSQSSQSSDPLEF